MQNNLDYSSSSSEANQLARTQRSRTNPSKKVYHSVKHTKTASTTKPANKRFSLRVRKKPNTNTIEQSSETFQDYYAKSQALLIGGSACSATSTARPPLLYNKNKGEQEMTGSTDSLAYKNQQQAHAQTAATTLTNVSMTSLSPFQVVNMPKHNIQVRNLKAKWNNVNRDVIFILYEIYNKAKRLRHNLSTQALKQYDVLTDQIVQNFASNQAPVMNQSAQNLNYTNLSKYF